MLKKHIIHPFDRNGRAVVQGKVTSAYFPSSFGGNLIKSSTPQRESHLSVGNIETNNLTVNLLERLGCTYTPNKEEA